MHSKKCVVVFWNRDNKDFVIQLTKYSPTLRYLIPKNTLPVLWSYLNHKIKRISTKSKQRGQKCEMFASGVEKCNI